MPQIWQLILVVYLLGVVVIPYPFYETFLKRKFKSDKKAYPSLYRSKTEPSKADRTDALGLALFVAFFWPVALTALILIGGVWMTSRRIWTGSWEKEDISFEENPVIEVKPKSLKQ